MRRSSALNITFTCLFLATWHLPSPAGQDKSSQPAPETVLKVQREIELLRGEKFKSAIRVENQSVEDFGKYLDRAIEKQIPTDLLKNYGKIVRKLGLYSGPEIQDFAALAKHVLRSQAAAYYDTDKNTFFVVMQNLPALALKAVYAHELYHGLQDQHYNLDSYLLLGNARKLNDDEALARQAVVEGEATYVMTLWSLKQTLGFVPSAEMLRIGLQRQSDTDTAALIQMLKANSAALGAADLAGVADELEKIPRFMLESMVSTYLKGMAFVFEIQQLGWNKVEELYSNPPASTEQILHPDKWVKNERPITIAFPELTKDDLFARWRMLESNTLGELQWRTVFAENSLQSIGASAADGWNGDRYAVLEHSGNSQLLLLLWTAWDTEDDATEFHEAYKRLLEIKYDGVDEFTRVERTGKTVLIVEGGEEDKISERVAYLKNLK